MLCCSVLLLLAGFPLLSSHPVFWTTSRTPSPGTAGRISNLERNKQSGRNMDQGGQYQPRNIEAVGQDVSIHSLLPTYNCYRRRCPSTVRSSRRRNLPYTFVTESLYARFVQAVMEQAVLQALETGKKHQQDKKTSTNISSTLNTRSWMFYYVPKTRVSPLWVFMTSYVCDDSSYFFG